MTTDQDVRETAEATSADGRLFVCTVTDGVVHPPGVLVALTDPAGTVRIGQVDDHAVGPQGAVTVTGSVYATVDGTGGLVKGSTAFRSATVAAADSQLVDLLSTNAGASLDVGRLTANSGAAARLVPQRFNRHTFWCGQSGSGKTYALGVLLEELLLHTELPLVIFDPNADFVRLGEVREDADPAQAEALARRPVRVLRAGDGAGESLRVQFTALTRSAKAAVLRLDPLVDRAEYNTLLHLEEILSGTEPGALLPTLLASDDPAVTNFAARLENLGLLSWEIWALGKRPATEIIRSRPAATVLDLGGFKSREEPLVVALSVLDDLWARRNERRPALLVIDEAHNLCSPDAETALERAVLDRIIQIAAEGRKYGLWLLLSTQRPSKVHPNIVSQCDNLALMRMGSQNDLAELSAILSFAPAALVAQSPRFRQGEALFAGGFVAAPTSAQMRKRLTYEGGHDVKVPLPQA